jgi:hypothetical protein
VEQISVDASGAHIYPAGPCHDVLPQGSLARADVRSLQ